MSKVAVVTDSTAYLPKEVAEKLNISVAPQVLIWDDKTYLDGVDIQPTEFYERLEKSATMPSTSQVSPSALKDIFENLNNQGYDVIAVLVSSKLSGTIASANQALEMAPHLKVEIVDSLSVSMALGFQAIVTAQAAADGATVKECKEIAEDAKTRCGVLFAVDTLEFLHRGGRIGGATRFLGTALKLKPLMEFVDGRIEPIERVRTKRKSHYRLVELLEDRTSGKKNIRLATLHANASEDAIKLIDLACSKLDVVEKIYSEVSPVVGTHTGPGTVGLAYMTE